MSMYQMIYPKVRKVSSEALIMEAEDAYANGYVERRPRDVEDAIFLLEDAGHITIDNRR